MKQSYFFKPWRQLTCLLGFLALVVPRTWGQVATAIYYTQGSSTAALDAVKTVAATGAGGTTTLPASTTTLTQPTDIVVDRTNGYFYVADQYVGTGAIWRYNLNGGGQTRVVAATAGVTYNGLALDAANNRLYYTQAGATASQAALKVVSLGGTLPAMPANVTTLPATFTRPGDLALDAAAGVLYVADQHTAGSLIRVVLSSGAVTTLVAGVANATYNGLALDAANGRLYFTQGSADATLDALKLVTLGTSPAVTTLVSGSANFSQPTDLAFEPGLGQLYLTDQYVSTGPLLRYTVGVSNNVVSVSNRTALVSATTGAAYGGLALALSAAPVLTTSTGAVTAPEQVATTIDPGITVTDLDSPTLASGTVSISSGLVSAEDALSFTANAATTGNIVGSYSASTGVLTLTSAGATATLAQWQAALRSVTYRNASDAPTTAARTISFGVSDGSQTSNVATRTLNVQAVNDAPTNTVPASISTPYNTDVAFTGANAITVADADAGTASISTQLTVTNGALFLDGVASLTNPFSISGSVSSVNSSLPRIVFRPTPGFSGTATVTVLTNDLGNTGTGGALTATNTINITVAAAPALTATVSTTASSPTSTSPIPFAVSFSQSVGTTFIASDVTVTGGTLTSGSFSGSGAGPYTFTVTPSGSGVVTVSLAAGVANDANSTGNTASNSLSVQYNQPVTAAPTLASPANNSTTSPTPTFSGAAPAGSTVTIYLAAGGGAAQALGTTTATGGSFSFVPTTALAGGSYAAYVTAQSSGATVSANSNTNTFTVDATAPTLVSSNRQAPVATTTNATLLVFRVTFSEPVTGVDASDFTLTTTAGTVSNSGRTVSAVSGSVYDVTVSGVSGSGTVRLDLNASNTGIADAVGNPIGGGYTSGQTYTIDQTAPAVVLTTTAGSSTSTSPIPFAATFSEPVMGFSAGSIVVVNGTVTSGPTGSGSGPYTFSVTPTGNGRVAVSIVAGAAQDAAGNFSTASNTVGVTYALPVASGLSVQYQTGDLGQPTDNQIRPFLQLVNIGTTAVPYQGLTVRYWLTVENFSPLVTPIDYAKLGTSFVSAQYVMLATPRQGALGYIEYSFAAGAGSLAPGTDSGPIYGKAYKQNYSNFDETDDWSYQTSSSFTSNDHVTLYQNGTLIAGTEPPAIAANVALQVYAASRDASASTSYISVQLQVRNTGNVPVNYGDVKARYYFTRDGAQTVVPQLDYAKLGNNNVSLSVVTLASPVNGADAYVEITFAPGLGTFYPGSSTDDILFKLRKDNYSAFDQTNDYSFGSSTALILQNRITAYVGNQLVFGTPPSGSSARLAATSQPAGANAASIVAASGPLALTASPNPFGEQLTLRFALPTTQAYTLAVYDGQGRLVQQVARGEAPASQVQELAVPTHLYATGLYFVRLTTATEVQHLKLVKQ